MNLISRARKAQLSAQAQKYSQNVKLAEPYLLTRGISLQVAEMFQLGYVTQGQFQGRLCIPYLTPSGVVNLKYRCMETHDCKEAPTCTAKYKYEPGLGQSLYNAQALISGPGMAILTEGELDAICIQAYCGIATVAYPGTESWKRGTYWRLCFDGIPEVVIIADGDTPGKEAARKVQQDIGSAARIVTMPDGHDANSFIAQHGAAKFKEEVSA